jgi:hypothetical protein
MIREPGRVTVTQLDRDGSWLVALKGEHDAFTVAMLEQHTAAVWTTCRVGIVDLTEATFIDAAVAGWLVRARAAAASARLMVVARPGCVASRILDLAGVREILDCYLSPASARRQAG